MRSFCLALLGLGLAAGITCCSRPPQTPVARLLAGLERAVEERDAPAVSARLAPDFRGRSGLDRATAEAELRRYFALYDGLEVEYADLDATHEDRQARVSVRVLVSGKPKFEGRFGLRPVDSAPFRFTLRCSEHDGGLLVAEADWEEETLPQP